MIKFKEQKQTNSYVNNITNEEINLKLHEMLLNFFLVVKHMYLIYMNICKEEVIKVYLLILKNIFMINK